MNPRRTITLLQINDTHGYLEPHPELFWAGTRAEYRTTGGFVRLLTIFKRVRQERNGAVIALDNGDTFHGTFHAVESKGEALIEPVNRLGLDAWTVHWDFAYGPDRMRELAAKLNHPLLACNCYVEATGELAYPAFTVIERSGMRVGIIGIAATILDKTMPPHFSEGLRFTLGNEEFPGHIRTLRERERVVWDMIEDNLEHTLAADPYQQMGGYVKRCLGLTLYVKLENPAGSRLQQIFTDGEELKRDRAYTAAFVTTQGVPKKYGRHRRDLDLHVIDALKRYCAAHPCVNADLRGMVIAV